MEYVLGEETGYAGKEMTPYCFGKEARDVPWMTSFSDVYHSFLGQKK